MNSISNKMTEASLDGLPTELKIQILWQVLRADFVDIKSLVLASPGYHSAYLLERHGLVERYAKQQFGEDLDPAEALAAVRSKGIHYATKRDSAIALLDAWRRRSEIQKFDRSHSAAYRLDRTKSLEEAMELLRFNRKLRFLLEDISTNVPNPHRWGAAHEHPTPSQWENECLPVTFTVVERRRILRALCRLQILKNIFGDPILCLDHPNCDSCGDLNINHWRSGAPTNPTAQSYIDEEERRDKPEDIEVFGLFYATMPPWEYHEMGSVFGYFRWKCEVITDEISAELMHLKNNTPDDGYTVDIYFHDIIPIEERFPVYLRRVMSFIVRGAFRWTLRFRSRVPV